MTNSSFPVIVPLLLSIALGGCGEKSRDQIVARVGDLNITVSDLRSFQTRLPGYLKSDSSGVAAQRKYLNALIDRQILLLEVEARGLQNDPEVVERMKWEERKSVLREFRKREIRDKVAITEEEMRRRFVEEELDREVRVSNILVRTKEEAEEILDELAKGASFEELARERSIDPQTKDLGGDGGFCAKGEIITPGGEDIAFSLKVGEISQPFKESRGYQIVKVTDERPVPFERVAAKIRKALAREKFYLRRDALIEELTEKLKPSLNAEGLEILLQKGAPNRSIPPLSEQEKKRVLYTYNGGEITVGDYLHALRTSLQHPVSNDRAQVLVFATRYVVPDALFWEAARRMGLPEEPEIREWMRRRREDLLIEMLRKRDVVDQVEVTDAETRKLYEEHPDYFSAPEQVEIVEVLSPTQEEAEEILEKVREGYKLEELAAQYTIRERKGEKRTKFRMHRFERPIYGALVDSALSASVGQVRGPVATRGGYSVFKVVDKVGKRPEPYEKAKRRAAALLRIQKRQELFARMMAELRKKYASQVSVFEENLKVSAKLMAKASGNVLK